MFALLVINFFNLVFYLINSNLLSFYFTPAQSSIEEPIEDSALDVSWPSTRREQITYVLLAPITLPLWFTLPDVRRPVSGSVIHVHHAGLTQTFCPTHRKNVASTLGRSLDPSCGLLSTVI